MKNYIALLLLLGCVACTGNDSQTDQDSPAGNADTEPTARTLALEDLDYAACNLPGIEKTGCSCDWRPASDDYKRYVLSADMEGNGCIRLDGNQIRMKGGQTDQRFEMYERTFEKNWIVFNERGPTTLFGEPLGTDEEVIREKLVQYLLLMDELPETIPATMNGTVGMGQRAAFRDVAQEAIEIARTRRAAGDRGIPVEFSYESDGYKVIVEATVNGKNDSGGETYAGTLRILDKAGNVLATQEVFGGCDC